MDASSWGKTEEAGLGANVIAPASGVLLSRPDAFWSLIRLGRMLLLRVTTQPLDSWMRPLSREMAAVPSFQAEGHAGRLSRW